MAESKERFLVIRLSSIGDIVHAVPAVSALGETFPSAEIHWAVEPRHADLLEGNPYVHRIVKLDTLGWRKHPALAETIEEVFRGVLALREVEYVAAIDFQGLYKSAILAWLSRARERVGFAEGWRREPGVSAFYTVCVTARGRRHVIEMNMALVERLGARPGRWQFMLPGNDRDECYIKERLVSLGAREFVLMSPGGGWKSKCWPPASYAELIRRLDPELPWKFLLTGSPEEEGLIQEILRQAGSGKASYFPSTIVQFIALVRRAKLFVGGDTGPMHLAAAVGTPIVALFGPTDPARNGPFSPDDIALSSGGPIDHRRRAQNGLYLSGISVESVLEAVRRRLTRVNG